jgi:hypothetical protein
VAYAHATDGMTLEQREAFDLALNRPAEAKAEKSAVYRRQQRQQQEQAMVAIMGAVPRG